jgi:hypothetical protein
MKQRTFAMVNGFEKAHRTTRKGAFLERMETLVPWAEFCAQIEPYYPKAGNGRPPVGVERMLRMYFLANWFIQRFLKPLFRPFSVSVPSAQGLRSLGGVVQTTGRAMSGWSEFPGLYRA